MQRAQARRVVVYVVEKARQAGYVLVQRTLPGHAHAPARNVERMRVALLHPRGARLTNQRPAHQVVLALAQRQPVGPGRYMRFLRCLQFTRRVVGCNLGFFPAHVRPVILAAHAGNILSQSLSPRSDAVGFFFGTDVMSVMDGHDIHQLYGIDVYIIPRPY